LQRCWAHKIRNVLNKAKKRDQKPMKLDLHRIMYASNRTRARKAARSFADRWHEIYPKAVKCLRDDLDELLAFLKFIKHSWRMSWVKSFFAFWLS
jgi:transposase-like protein